MAKQKTVIGVLRHNLIGVESIGKNKAGNLVIRRGFYYRHGGTPEQLAERVLATCKLFNIPAELVDCGENWKPFAGGKGVAQNSHWWAEIKVVDKGTLS
jgi:hypothetical protein